jgi:glycosyltransferase involved in cell wall biosynthesis
MPNNICLVIPCFNESARLSTGYLLGLKAGLECDLFFVDDGSTDGTNSWLEHNLPESEILRLPKNVGKARAVAIGLTRTRSRYEFIAVCDADGAISIEDWRTALNIIETNHDLDVVSGARVLLAGMPVERKSMRKWVGRIVATIVSLIVNLQIYDPQSPCKIYRSKFIESLDMEEFRTKWFLDAEMFIAKGGSVEIREFSLSNWSDIPGSHLGIYSFFEVTKDLANVLLLKLSKFRSN